MFSLDLPSLLIGAGIPVIVYLLWYVYCRPIMPTNIYPVRMAGSRAGDSVVMKRIPRSKHTERKFRENDSPQDKDNALLQRKYIFEEEGVE